jgi:DNA-3-methyladenine glycosylase
MYDLLLSADTAARDLLGMKLIANLPGGKAGGFIVETEAYSMDDPASHAYRGKTARNESMFCEAGTIYVYFTYGMHYCLNIVTAQAGIGEAVLIRALEPVMGLKHMSRRRNTENKYMLANGPAKLTQALGVTKRMNGTNLYDGPIHIESGFEPERIGQSRRIGITKGRDFQCRYFVTGSRYLSRHGII